MSYSHIEGVIFDLGSTLIEFENSPWLETTYKGLERGYRWLSDDGYILPDFDVFARQLAARMDELRSRATDTLKERQSTDAPELYFAEMGMGDPRELSRRFMEVFYTAVTDQMAVCDGALETLRELCRRGYKTGMISNTPFRRDQLEADLARYGLTPYLGFRVYSSHFGVRKPHPGIFQEGLRQIGLPPEKTMYVGDHYAWDIQGAQTVGMTAVLKYREGREYPDPMPNGFRVIRSLPELLEILRG